MPIKKIRFIKRLSLKSRLVLAAVVWLTAMIIAAGVMMPSQVYLYMQEDTKQQLSIYMDEIAAALEADEKGNLKLTSPLSDPRFTRPYSGFYWSAKTDKALLRSRSLWDKNLTTKDEHDLLGHAMKNLSIFNQPYTTQTILALLKLLLVPTNSPLLIQFVIL